MAHCFDHGSIEGIQRYGSVVARSGSHVRLFLDSHPLFVNHLSFAVPGPKHSFIIRRTITGEDRMGRVAMTPLATAALNGHDVSVNVLLVWIQKHYHEASAAKWK